MQQNFSSFSFLQILTNTVFLNNPILNNVPDVSVEPNMVALEADNSDGFVTSVHDPDGDTLRLFKIFGGINWGWLFGYQNWLVTTQCNHLPRFWPLLLVE